MFSWLHLTDLHFGLSGQSSLWPNLREAFFEDLRSLHDRTGPWDAVLFTGDFVQRGTREEYLRLDTEVLEPLWQHLETLGSGTARLFAVPGNHDLVRPAIGRKPTASEKFLLKPGLFEEVAEEFWTDPFGEYRAVVNAAFANYLEWRDRCRYLADLRDGILPGDFAASLPTSEGKRVGLLGLNTTFLQLAAGDYQGRLVWDPRQFHAACGGDGPNWVKQHHVCLLLTHQGPEWLDVHSRDDVSPEINPAGRFAVHCFGHMHENVIRSMSSGGGKPLRLWQGNSLFSQEPITSRDGNAVIERRHGYAAGRIEFQESTATLRHWPRIAFKDGNGWRLKSDHQSCVLREGDGGTEPESIELNQQVPLLPPSPSGTGLTRRQGQLLATYRKTALAQIDIVDLANLPEDDRRIAMQRFLLRQLYIPLRLRVDAPTADELDEKTLLAWEQDRDRAKRLAAGRSSSFGPSSDEAEDASAAQRSSLGDLLSRRPVATQPTKKRRKKPTKLEPASAVVPDTPARLVILGDPGGGKTTLLRWLATAWLLRSERPEDVAAFPEADTLPPGTCLPILIRCRQLDRARLGECTLAEILLQTLRLLELKLPEADVAALVETLVEQLEKGEAALLVDGLDEIAESQLRSRFCERLETIAERYPHAPLLATSRIVGYREMPRRLGRGFRHATLAELSPTDKDDFVRRWCETVEHDPTRRREEAAKLLQGIHDSSRRIERLTGNPMLLTTMALVQRKVGRLPAKRHKLYEEAVGVLLNWRSDVDLPIDPDEAWPQLEYVAWAMCDRGVQRLRRDEVLGLLEAIRRDSPNLRAVAQRTPEGFLKLVEARTSLLVEVGTEYHDGRETPVYEFRHLTLQEYLAAIALIRGHFPCHDPKTPLAERVRPLAGRITTDKIEGLRRRAIISEPQVTENWREALRLCVAACNDDDVDATLHAILGNLPDTPEARPRAILAALCLADEPNASQTVAQRILRQFVAVIHEADGIGYKSTGLSQATLEVATSRWAEPLIQALMVEFLCHSKSTDKPCGTLAGRVAVAAANLSPVDINEEKIATEARIEWMQMQTECIAVGNDSVATAAALGVMRCAFELKACLIPGLSTALLALTARGSACSHAACWALWWLTGGHGRGGQIPLWQPTASEMDQLVRMFPVTEGHTAVGEGPASPLSDPKALRYLTLIAANLQSDAFVPGLKLLLTHERRIVRATALESLLRLRADQAGAQLIQWCDPREPIDESNLQEAARKLNLPVEEIRQRYERLAAEYGLTLAFATPGTEAT